MNGIVYRVKNAIYLSLFDKNNNISDGIPISEHPYETLKKDQLCFVDVVITDGTKEVQIADVNTFIYETRIGHDTDIFYKIKDISTVTIGDEGQQITIQRICENGEINKLVQDIVANLKPFEK